MSVKIAEAYSDENGKARGGSPGDQNSKEIRVRDWYKRDGGWQSYIECTDEALADRAASIAEKIALSPQFGYSQDARWTGHKAILKAGSVEKAEASDYDCSSLCISAYILAGLDIKAEGYTGNIERILKGTGKFVSYSDSSHVNNANLAKRGSMYLAAGHHVMMVLDDGPTATQQANAEAPTYETDGPYVVSKGSVNIRSAPVDGKILGVLRKGQALPYVTTWHQVEFNGEKAWISGKSSYTEVWE